jgi:hypothetical protein
VGTSLKLGKLQGAATIFWIGGTQMTDELSMVYLKLLASYKN